MTADPAILRSVRPLIALLLVWASASLSGCLCRARRADDLPAYEVAIRRDVLVQTARGLIGQRRLVVHGKRFRFDCSGFVSAVYHAVGVDLMALARQHPGASGTMLIHAYGDAVRGLHRRTPEPGDIVFFDNTYDTNGYRRLNDELSHVGLVEQVDSDGTVQFIHRGGRGIVRGRLNLERPSDHRDESGKELNSYLRRKQRDDRWRTRYLAGELFAGYASVVGREAPGGT